MRDYLNFLRSALLWIAFFKSIFILALIEPFVRPDIFAAMVKSAARLILFCGSVKVKLTGQPEIPEGKGLIIAANHQSFLDNLVLLGYFPRVFKIVAAEAGFKLPFMRRIYRGCGFIRTGLKMNYEDVVALYSRLKKNDIMLIYGAVRKAEPPRFTDAMLNFAAKTEVPILPVRIKGASDILPMRKFILKEGEVELVIAPLQKSDISKDELRRFFAS